MIVNCVAYQHGKKLADIPAENVHDYLAKPGCFVWLALQNPSDEEINRISIEFSLHELAVEDARKGHQRPKLEEYGDLVFLVMKTLELDENAELQVGEVALFVGKNYVISLRTGTRRGFADVRKRCEREPHLLKHGSGFVLYALLDAVVDRYLGVLHRLEDELDEIEDTLFHQGSSARDKISRLYQLKRKLISANHAVSPLHEATARLYGGRVPAVCQGIQEYFRDVDDHMSRLLHAIESQREMLATAIQVNIALISLEDSNVSKKLAAYAALFAIPTMIAGVYGMNFEFMPELKSHYGYPFALSSMLVLDALLWYRFRKAGWI